MTQLAQLLDVVSPRTGIVKSLNLRVKSDDQPALPYIYEGLLAHHDFRRAERRTRAFCGKGLTEESAMLGAIGEAVERYCAAHVAPGGTHRAAYASLGDEAVPPADFVLYSDAQRARVDLGFWHWKAEDEILWTRVDELGSGAQLWVPSAFIYLTYASDRTQDLICAPSSSGCAAGPDRNSAIRSAILELVERDAFMITWLCRLPAVEIETTGIGGIIGEICATYQRWGTEIRAFALPTDMTATVVMAVALDRSGAGPAAVVGLGCEMSPADALRKSLFEICQMHEPLRQRNKEGDATRLNAYADVKTLDDHAAYFFPRDHFHELDFLLNSARKIRIGDLADHSGTSIEDDLRILARGVAACGCRAFYCDLTTPDLDAYPIRVVRALITHLQPISFGYGLERLGGRRLYDRGGIPEASLNRCPHPLA
jgi:ribosomal protein S12 methylthiotransferase accessory factor